MLILFLLKILSLTADNIIQVKDCKYLIFIGNLSFTANDKILVKIRYIKLQIICI